MIFNNKEAVTKDELKKEAVEKIGDIAEKAIDKINVISGVAADTNKAEAGKKLIDEEAAQSEKDMEETVDELLEDFDTLDVDAEKNALATSAIIGAAAFALTAVAGTVIYKLFFKKWWE